LYQEYVKAQADSQTLWHQAKEKSDYALFKPALQKTMELSLKGLQYHPDRETKDAYDILLDQYERGTDQQFYDRFFDVIREDLPPLIAKIKEAKQIDDSFLRQERSIENQEQFAKVLMEILQADPNRVYLSTTEHPFTNFISHDDVRITTHYYPDAFLSAVLSTVHEYGHALYALQADPKFDKTMLMEAIGSAAHETQSRFLENHIGRSESFWQLLYPELVQIFPEFQKISSHDLYRMINVSTPSLIRTEADELTYTLHILIRYEIEKEIANGTADYEKLPELWADKYEQYLGIKPSSDKEGILQDMHWSAGYLGYFPTYALGSAYAAQLYEAMEKEFDVSSAVSNGEIDKVTGWLERNVHRFGASKSMKEIVEEVSGKEFDPKIYTKYLIDKYSRLYRLKSENS
jgi:carboxypeptidase Taq